METVKKKIQILQQHLDEAEERELAVQREFDTEHELRDKVRYELPFVHFSLFTFNAHIPVGHPCRGL